MIQGPIPPAAHTNCPSLAIKGSPDRPLSRRHPATLRQLAAAAAGRACLHLPVAASVRGSALLPAASAAARAAAVPVVVVGVAAAAAAAAAAADWRLEAVPACPLPSQRHPQRHGIQSTSPPRAQGLRDLSVTLRSRVSLGPGFRVRDWGLWSRVKATTCCAIRPATPPTLAPFPCWRADCAARE
eukprot:2883306-Rhodomonas_salina.3